MYNYKTQKLTLNIYYKNNNPRVDLKLNNQLIARSRYIQTLEIYHFVKETKTIIIKEINKLNQDKKYKPKTKKLKDIKNALIPEGST